MLCSQLWLHFSKFCANVGLLQGNQMAALVVSFPSHTTHARRREPFSSHNHQIQALQASSNLVSLGAHAYPLKLFLTQRVGRSTLTDLGHCVDRRAGSV